MSAAKWSILIFVFFGIMWFMTPLIFKAMKKKDFDSMYHTIQGAKRKVGAYVDDEENKPKFRSFEEQYVTGDL